MPNTKEIEVTPFFSICLPVYNGADYIGKAIQSVLDQTFQDWELVIYNNGSTDSTSEVILWFKDSRIRIIEETERSSKAIPAWHKTMTMGKGEYLLMLGHDDWFKTDFLEVAHRHIEKHNLDVFSGWTDCYDPEYKFIEVAPSASFIQAIPNAKQEGDLWLFDGKGYIEGFLKDFDRGFSKMHLSTTWIRRELYEKVGGFNVGLQYCAESELYLKLAHAGAKFGFLRGRSLVNYIGTGFQRRAALLEVTKKYHDFYRIPKIMHETGMADTDEYRTMLSAVNRQAVMQGRGYPLGAALRYNFQYNGGTHKVVWFLLLTGGWFWSRTRRAIDYLFERLMKYAGM